MTVSLVLEPLEAGMTARSFAGPRRGFRWGDVTTETVIERDQKARGVLRRSLGASLPVSTSRPKRFGRWTLRWRSQFTTETKRELRAWDGGR